MSNRGTMRKVTCPECGKSMGASGIGRHARAHEDARKAQGGVQALERLVRTERTPEPVAALSGDPGDLPGALSTLDVAMAVMLKMSPDGRVPVAALPEVLAWIEHTDRTMKLIGSL